MALLLLLLLLLLLSGIGPSVSTSFDFPSFSLRNLTLLGDAYLQNSTVGLTLQTPVPSSSSGTAFYNLPIPFRSGNASVSFSTNFSFSITNPNPESSGHGLTFFLSPSNQTLGGVGAFLGVFNSSGGDSPVVVVEFDTHLDVEFADVSSNHVGLDVGGPVSVNSTDLGGFGIDLKSGVVVSAWIEYLDDEKVVRVWVDYSNVKPEKPALVVNYDLLEHLEEFMFVGFSASTEGSTEIHTIIDWSFRTFGLPDANVSTLVPRNSSEGEWNVIPSLTATKSDSVGHKKISLGLGIAGPIGFSICFVLVVWFSIKKRLCQSKNACSAHVVKGPRKFSYKELSISTRGFHIARVIGSGAFGTVYRAVHPVTGVSYAVKRSKHYHQGKTEFLAELSIIACLRHKNLVQLEGWCDEKNELLLVYEFMPNGSLDKILYQGRSLGDRSAFKWSQRYNVAVGISSVLMYLHEGCEQQVIHRDIKTSNILLDACFNPRLGDFGLARLMDHDKSPVSTLTAGTLGYLAPEYVQYGKATEKTDVFSFGVVVLEVCCGRLPIDKSDDSTQNLVNLVDWVWALYGEDKLIDAADPRLRGEFDRDQMVRLLMVGLSCANPDCSERPSMRRVLQILNFEMEPKPVSKLKPCLTFSCSLPQSLRDIVSDDEESMNISPLHEVILSSSSEKGSFREGNNDPANNVRVGSTDFRHT